MFLAIGLSIAIRILALIWSVVLLHRIRDWRFGFLTIMIALMAVRQILTLWNLPASQLTDMNLVISELPGLIVSIMAFLSVYFLGEILASKQKTQKNLKESEERFVHLTNNLEEIFWITSIDGEKVEYVSPAYETIFQRKVKDLYRDPRSWITFILKEDQSKVIETFTKENLIAGLFNVEYRIIRPDGSLRWIRAKGKPVKDDLGQVTRIAGIAADITQEKLTELALKNTQAELEDRVLERTADLVKANENLHREMTERQRSVEALEESEEKFRQIAENVEEVFWMEDLERAQIIYISPAFEKIWGIPLEELSKNPKLLIDSIHPEDRPRIKELKLYNKNQDTLLSGQQRHEFRVIRPDGSIRWILDKAFPVFNSKGIPIRIVGISEDITDLKIAQETAEQANRAKSEFLSHMSHELRTPLNAILGFAQLLGLNKNGNLEPKQIEGIRQISTAGNHLLELINEVLDLTRIESGSLKIFKENTDVTRMLKRLLPLLEPLARERNIEIKNCLPENELLYVLADPTRLKQALVNIVNNAIKYNVDNGTVIIETEPISNQKFRIHVRDSGPGIPSNRRDSVFEPFERLGADKAGIEGTGIGLTITQKLIALMDGSVTVESELGKGSCFTIELPAGNFDNSLPAKSAFDTVPAEIEAENKNPKAVTILYIEDNPSNLKLVRNFLEEFTSYQLISSPDAIEGLKMASTHQPSLILLDINLPKMSGLTVLKKLKNSQTTNKIPVIAVSANAMENDIQTALDAGFAHYLTKPIDLDRLAKTIQDILQHDVDLPSHP